MSVDRRPFCTSLTGRHKYQPRYDEKPSPVAQTVLEHQIVHDYERDLLILRIYIHDICVLCGDVIERERPE